MYEGYANETSVEIAVDSVHPVSLTQHITLHFKNNEFTIDPLYKDNEHQLSLLDSLFRVPNIESNLLQVAVSTFASPYGDNETNCMLSKQRGEYIKALLQDCYPTIRNRTILFLAERENWGELRRRVEDDLNFSDRKEVLMLIDYYRDDVETGKQLLLKMNNGISYRYIATHILPALRRSVIAITYELPMTYALVSDSDCRKKQNGEILVEDTLSIANNSTTEKNELRVRTNIPSTNAYNGFQCQAESKKLVSTVNESIEVSADCSLRRTLCIASNEGEGKAIIAIKNNLLYDLVIAPNLEIEIPVGKRWSLNAEYKFPWWLNNRHNFCYQVLSGGLEGRYWLGNRQERDLLTGHFTGIYAEGGVYDFQWGNDGYQGKYYVSSGFTYGYGHKLSTHLSLEFSIGIGYLYTEYKKYTPYMDEIVTTRTGHLNYVGPTKAKVSLVWLITSRR